MTEEQSSPSDSPFAVPQSVSSALDTGANRHLSMKKTKSRISYKNEPKEAGWEFNPAATALNEKAISALGIPSPSDARTHLKRKQAKETRINVRLSAKTLAGLKQQAEEAGMPYQTLAASALHMLATGKLRLAVVTGG